MNEEIFIEKVLSYPGQADALTAYKTFYKQLGEVTFAYFDGDAAQKLPCESTYKKEKTFEILQPCSAGNLFFIDCDTELGSNIERTVLPVLQLGSSGISHIRKTVSRDTSETFEHLKPFMHYILSNDIQIDALFYMLENTGEGQPKNSLTVYENILAAERFKSIDREKYIRDRKIFYALSDYELKENTGKTLHEMNKKLNTCPDFTSIAKYIYALLIKGLSIEFSSSKSARSKLLMLLDFSCNELGLILENELVLLASYYLRNEYANHFFRFLKSDSRKLIKNLSSMSWYMTQIRMMETLLLERKDTKYTLHSFLTFDSELKTVLDLNSVTRCAVSNNYCLTKNKIQLADIFKQLHIDPDTLYELSRKRTAFFHQTDIELLIDQLETELLKPSQFRH